MKGWKNKLFTLVVVGGLAALAAWSGFQQLTKKAKRGGSSGS